MTKATNTAGPTTTVAAIIVSDSLQILLTKRNVDPFRDRWCLPGGHIDRYEGVHEAIRREVKEETGLYFDGDFFKWFEEIFPDMNIHNVVIVFKGKGSGSLGTSDEVTEMKWFSESEIKDLPLAFTHNEILEAYFSGDMQS